MLLPIYSLPGNFHSALRNIFGGHFDEHHFQIKHKSKKQFYYAANPAEKLNYSGTTLNHASMPLEFQPALVQATFAKGLEDSVACCNVIKLYKQLYPYGHCLRKRNA